MGFCFITPSVPFAERRIYTHGPLGLRESLPLEEYVDALREVEYQGIYNLELDFRRFPDDEDPVEHIFGALARLNRALAGSGLKSGRQW
ncbi:Xylose isomerase-like, TIM barrel domain protein [Acididesulfobacillus acetoxydans]|uniref:Xylose isomerase-like, TIM barrel domain protein n=3 Tax=Acididesulfobacillus acetoxydans TaxID=1561005 RepID=A0A8S0W761_9FIRM|nr:Xylose isomerase-like, TIM barrel domain protein [Acididesulfobacillus acetoxydans]